MTQDTAHRPRRSVTRFSLLLTVMLVAAALSVPSADAATPWKTFGSGSAVGRGDFGSPHMSVDSTTKKNPERVRFLIRGAAVKIDVSWSIDCWDDVNFRFRSASGSFTRKPPITVDISNGGWVSSFQFCELDVSAFSFKNGDLQVHLQARYP